MDHLHRLIVAKIQEETSRGLEDNRTPQDAESILKILDTALAENEEHVRGQPPPLDVIIYALNNILHPTFVPELMSDFLHLFTMVEFYRMWITEKAALALELNIFYQSSPDPHIALLTKDEELFLRTLIDGQGASREIFMTVVAECCTLDLQRLWLADSNVNFWVRWNEYLSVIGSSSDETTSQSFHYKLSADEIVQLRNVGEAVLNFMHTTVEAGQQLKGQSIHEAVKTKDFQAAYLPIEMSSEVLEAIEYHQNLVQEAIQKFTVHTGMSQYTQN